MLAVVISNHSDLHDFELKLQYHSTDGKN